MTHKKTLEELKREASAELERRGYNVRGKTPAQVRQMLRTRRPKAKATSLEHGILFHTTSKTNLMTLLVKYRQHLCLRQRKDSY